MQNNLLAPESGTKERLLLPVGVTGNPLESVTTSAVDFAVTMAARAFTVSDVSPMLACAESVAVAPFENVMTVPFGSAAPSRATAIDVADTAACVITYT